MNNWPFYALAGLTAILYFIGEATGLLFFSYLVIMFMWWAYFSQEIRDNK